MSGGKDLRLEDPQARAALNELRGRRKPFSRYLSLVTYKTYADLKAESERTYAGFLWWIVEPIVSMAVYYLVFKVILDRGTEHFVQFLFVGLVPWRWLQTSLTHGANSILSERSLMQQVYLPKVVFPMVSILTDTVKFFVVFVLMMVFVWTSGFAPAFSYLALPLVLFVQFLLISGLTVLFAGIAPLLPDIRIVLSNVVRLWFFLSGVFYSVDRFEAAAEYLRLNPMTVVLESYRTILLDRSWPDLERLIAVGLFGFAVCVVGLSVIRRYEYIYPKLRL